MYMLSESFHDEHYVICSFAISLPALDENFILEYFPSRLYICSYVCV